MATATLSGFLQHLRKAMAAETLTALSDRELVERFLESHEEAPFQALLQRHGPMVLRVCRRTLANEQDIEDAFQATFLVLAREARAIRKHESLASWLHGVAYRVSLDARKARARRRKHEAHAAAGAGTVALTDESGWKELRSVLDEELVRLPERLGAPLVLCYLEGLTQDEAAVRLGQSKSTCRRNLERGRELLGASLTRRGVTLSAALFAPLLSECAASAAVPAALATSTTEAAAALAAGNAVTALATARAIVLAQGLVQPVLTTKVKCVCVLLFAVLAGFGGAALPRDTRPVEPPPPAEHQEAAKTAANDPHPDAKVDQRKVTERIEFRIPFLVLHVEVQTELKLDAEQVRKIRETIRIGDVDAGKLNQRGDPAEAANRLVIEQHKVPQVDARGKAEDFQVKLLQAGEPAEAANKLVIEKQKALQKALPDILTNTQALRLRQLERQRGGSASFQDPENEKLLNLTDEQRGKIQTIIARARETRPPVPQGKVDVIAYEEAFKEAFKEAEKSAVRRILDTLTDDQKKTWRDLTGEAIILRSRGLSDLLVLAPNRFSRTRMREPVLLREIDPDDRCDR
jgi:RNA polymerase sigma factor (sigma-70 family)